MDYDKLFENFEEMNKTIAAAYEKMNAESKGIIVQASKMLYEKYPDLKSIHWTQYTPYFNDGDECEFGVHEICFTYGADETEEDLEPYDSNIYPLYSEATVNMWAERAALLIIQPPSAAKVGRR